MKQYLSREERWEIVKTLLQRDEVRADAWEAFRQAYPDAPEEMLNTAIFHTFVDGIGAAIDWLVALEMFLRNHEPEAFSGVNSHLLYHLYNWHQFEALLPEGKAGVLERLNEAKELLILDDDIVRSLDVLNDLEKMFTGGRNYPQLEEDT